MSDQPSTAEELAELKAITLDSDFEQVEAEAIVNHRIGFWQIFDPYESKVTAAELEHADWELEHYVQLRIARSRVWTDEQVEAASIAFTCESREDWEECSSTYRASILSAMRDALEATDV